jgi:putative endopeptidase
MDDTTRAEAQKKLATFEPRIGYPSKWRDYSALSIDAGKLFENVRNAHQFDWNRQVARLRPSIEPSGA